MEPFDEALDRRIWSLAAHRQGCHKAIAEKRREAPTRLAKIVDELYEHERKMEQGIPEMFDLEEDVGDITMEGECLTCNVRNMIILMLSQYKRNG